MCPSYMVTREEKHSTRGRARLLWEMLDGRVIGKKGWREESVFDALDLCLGCKGCKADCPVNVDMATYKAEFLSHYYKARLRPMHAYGLPRHLRVTIGAGDENQRFLAALAEVLGEVVAPPRAGPG